MQAPRTGKFPPPRAYPCLTGTNARGGSARDVNGREYLARMAELFDLPADVAAGLSHMELLGDRQLLLEGHEGLLAYGTELIDVSVGGAVLRVTGEGLTLKSMTEREVRIGGRIDGVEFLR